MMRLQFGFPIEGTPIRFAYRNGPRGHLVSGTAGRADYLENAISTIKIVFFQLIKISVATSNSLQVPNNCDKIHKIREILPLTQVMAGR
jgi:hypothetical protein